jgi:hypothetical protein
MRHLAIPRTTSVLRPPIPPLSAKAGLPSVSSLPFGNTYYESLQARLVRHFGRPSQIGFSYTFSKAVDHEDDEEIFSLIRPTSRATRLWPVSIAPRTFKYLGSMNSHSGATIATRGRKCHIANARRTSAERVAIITDFVELGAFRPLPFSARHRYMTA